MTTLAALLLWLTLSRGLFYLPALPADDRLQRVAQERADSIAATGYFGHCDTPAQSAGCTAAYVALDRQAGVPLGHQIGENIWAGHGYADADIGRAASLWWLASPEHRDNIATRAYTHVGFGVAWWPGTLGTLPGSGWLIVTEELGP